MAESLFFYKLISPYVDEQGKPVDVTKNCKLTINEIDSNFLTLKDYDIKTAEFVRGEDCKKSDGTLVLTRNNGDKLIVPLDVSVCENRNLTYDLNVDVTECGKSGSTLTISYKDDSGETSVTLDNIITADNLIDVIGSDILTKVISDDTLVGLGTMRYPLGLASIEKTGMLAPAKDVLDLTYGGQLPPYDEKGARYVTKESVSDYGYLYNGAGVEKIKKMLDKIYTDNEIVKEVGSRDNYWRVPSKEDWDKMLNSIEPCKYRNHAKADCHVELGKLAGKFLKSNCGCKGGKYPQSGCTCSSNSLNNGCFYVDDDIQGDMIYDDYMFDNTDDIPNEKKINPTGVDKYGMKILPSGVSSFINNEPRPSGFGEMSTFWTTSHIYNDPTQDIYLKVFKCDMSGVYQSAECPDPYYSVRLVKDYDGSNYRENEYIDGVLYKCVLFPESGQIWLARNFANTEGFIGYDEITSEYPTPDYLAPNNGFEIDDKRTEMFINEFNGRNWEKKVMAEGTTIVIQKPSCPVGSSFDYEWVDDEGNPHDISVDISGDTVTYTWIDSEGVTQIYTIDIEFASQENLEYRVFVDENCEKYLKNVNDLIVERILNIIIPLIDKERNDREKADDALSGAIDDLADVVESISGDVADLRDDVDELSGKVETLSGEVIDLREDLDEEIIRAMEAEEEISGLTIVTTEDYILSASTVDGNYNLVLPSKDGNPDHFIKIKFDGNFGEF